ncbi:MAG: heavy-metal-associated domain-containing protein [Candidatus Marinimicrobia bacterium]|nr:heavy-metal-associated domain-containing protein [Candidatus Neomarinimicrobiota bacterium]
MSKIKLVVLSIFIIGIGIHSNQLLASGKGDSDIETTVIKIEGMSCSFCAKTAEKSMTSAEGVESVKLDLDSGLATVTYDKQKTNPEKIASTVKKDTRFDSEVVTAESKETK